MDLYVVVCGGVAVDGMEVWLSWMADWWSPCSYITRWCRSCHRTVNPAFITCRRTCLYHRYQPQSLLSCSLTADICLTAVLYYATLPTSPCLVVDVTDFPFPQANGLVADLLRDFFEPSQHVLMVWNPETSLWLPDNIIHVDSFPVTSQWLPQNFPVSWGSFGEVGVMEFGLYRAVRLGLSVCHVLRCMVHSSRCL